MAVLTAIAMTACSSGNPPADNASPQMSAPTVADNSMLGDEPASSASAQAAKEVVTRYFALLDQHDYRAAYALWGNAGADTRGTLAQFAEGIKAYSVYDAKVGEPTAIKSRDGKQYILVTATIDVKSRKNGQTAARSGTVMLSRSADPEETAADKKEWRIWGTDIRVKH